MRTIEILGLAALLSATAPALAKDDGGWNFVIQPYFLVPAMDGSSAVGPINADVDISRKDVLSNLNMGFLGYLEASRGNIAFGVDTNYMNLDATPDARRINADIGQLAVQPMLFYRVGPWFELMAGARYNKIKVKIESTLPIIDGRSRSVAGWIRSWASASRGR